MTNMSQEVTESIDMHIDDLRGAIRCYEQAIDTDKESALRFAVEAAEIGRDLLDYITRELK